MIRSVKSDDLPALKAVLNNSDLFPAEYLEEMISDYITNPDSGQIWYTFVAESNPVAIAYCAPMELANGTFNLYAIGIHKDYQHRGIGTQMMDYIEGLLREKGNRLLIVETSSSKEQLAARNFYTKCGYTHEATLRDFWDEGEDKIVFWKKL